MDWRVDLTSVVIVACSDGRKLKRFASIDLEPERVIDRFESCLPVGFDIETSAFPVQKGELPNWFEPDKSRATLRAMQG